MQIRKQVVQVIYSLQVVQVAYILQVVQVTYIVYSSIFCK